ncbi:MAG: hypothetical protein IJU86_04115 [Firmicutes bacterium]|nr:hypothetical protein [Bacillota bacterium]
MSGANEKEIINETNGQKSYYLRFKLPTGGYDCQVKVSLSPNDTVDKFIRKITPFFYDQNLYECDGTEHIGRLICAGKVLFKKEDASKPLNETDLWNAIKGATTKEKECTLHMLASLNPTNNWFLDYKPETFGELPLYEVRSGEEAVNPNEKHNQFQATDKSVGLSLSPRRLEYHSPNIFASNPLHRFICSNHLRTQYDEGRLANAEGIFNRKLDSKFGPEKKEEKDGTMVTQRVEPRGWQGIDKSKYSEVNGKGEADKDAQDWYEKLDDIILDKAYLSVNENLDTLISAAGHFYEENKITFEQFTNVMLMLRYAYELRQLPNDKDANELNSNPDPIKLNQQSYLTIQKIFTQMKDELISKFGEIEKMINNSQVLKDDNKELNLLENVDPTHENGNNELLGMMEEEDTKKFRLVMDFVIKNKDKENELISKLKERNQNYIDTLTNILNSKLVEKSDKDIKKYVDKIKKAWEETKHEGIGKFIQKLDSDGYKSLYFKESDEDRSSLAKINLLLSDSDKKQLEDIKTNINNLSNDLDEHKKILDLETFKKCVGYTEMFTCAQYIEKNEVNVKVKLTWGQWLLNLLFSLGHLLSYRFYREFEVKMDSVVNFKDRKDDIFAKFNKKDLDRYRLSYEDKIREMNNMSDDSLYMDTNRLY